MSERKVLNKYYPPEYDPDKFPTLGRSSKRSGTVRLMAPFSMRCQSCGEFIYKGKKFNARKENTDDFYLTIRILRFYIRCPKCASEITFRTDPQNTDYQVELGATRNFEPWKEEKQQELQQKRRREEEEQGNPLKALENKTLDSKKEIEIFEALDEIRALNDRNYRLDPASVLQLLERKVDAESDAEEADFVARQQSIQPKVADVQQDPNTLGFIKTLFHRRLETQPKEEQKTDVNDTIPLSDKSLHDKSIEPAPFKTGGLLTNSATGSFVIPGIVIKKKKLPKDEEHKPSTEPL